MPSDKKPPVEARALCDLAGRLVGRWLEGHLERQPLVVQLVVPLECVHHLWARPSVRAQVHHEAAWELFTTADPVTRPELRPVTVVTLDLLQALAHPVDLGPRP